MQKETTGSGPRESRAAAKSFEDLVVWQNAHRFVMPVYHLTQGFPQHEMFGLTSQLRRAAVSIPASIVEGFGKRGKADRARFLNIAQGSVEECGYYLILARDLQYAETADCSAQLSAVARLLGAYASAVLDSRR